MTDTCAGCTRWMTNGCDGDDGVCDGNRPTTQRCEDYAPISEDGERMNKTQQHDAELIVQATPDGMRRRIAELEAENERLRAQQVADEKRGARALIEQLCSSRVDRDYIEGRFDVCFGREIARGEGGK